MSYWSATLLVAVSFAAVATVARYASHDGGPLALLDWERQNRRLLLVLLALGVVALLIFLFLLFGRQPVAISASTFRRISLG